MKFDERLFLGISWQQFIMLNIQWLQCRSELIPEWGPMIRYQDGRGRYYAKNFHELSRALITSKRVCGHQTCKTGSGRAFPSAPGSTDLFKLLVFSWYLPSTVPCHSQGPSRLARMGYRCLLQSGQRCHTWSSHCTLPAPPSPSSRTPTSSPVSGHGRWTGTWNHSRRQPISSALVSPEVSQPQGPGPL